MDLDELRAFIAVAKTGSFLAAAQSLRQPRATLRRRVNALESRAGVSLFERTHSGVVLTEPGSVLLDRGRKIIHEAGAVLASLRELEDEPSGELRVVMPLGAPAHSLTPLLETFHTRFPRMRATLRFSADPMNESEEFDIAVHYGLRSPKGPWSSLPLVRMRMGLLASKDYIEEHGMPTQIEDLAHHKLLSWQAPNEDPKRWPAYMGGPFAITPTLVCADSYQLRSCARAGMGIAMLPDADLPDPELAPGELVPVLPEQVGRANELRLVVHDALIELPKFRDLLDESKRAMQWVLGRDRSWRETPDPPENPSSVRVQPLESEATHH